MKKAVGRIPHCLVGGPVKGRYSVYLRHQQSAVLYDWR